jgi:hypothetical protein
LKPPATTPQKCVENALDFGTVSRNRFNGFFPVPATNSFVGFSPLKPPATTPKSALKTHSISALSLETVLTVFSLYQPRIHDTAGKVLIAKSDNAGKIFTNTP